MASQSEINEIVHKFIENIFEENKKQNLNITKIKRNIPLQIPTSLNGKNKKKGGVIKHRAKKSEQTSKSFESCNYLCEFETLNESEKLKKNYVKKYNILANRINALKKQEKEIETKLSCYKKKEKNIEQIKVSKDEFKKEIMKNKQKKLQLFTEQKQKIKTQKEIEQERINTLQEIKERKQKLLFEISKTDQTLVRTMISQSNTKNQAVNKYKYLQVKEKQEKFKQINQIKKIKQETQKKLKNKEKYEQNMEIAEEYRAKCEELARIEEEYIKNLQTTRIKTNTFLENNLINKIGVTNNNNNVNKSEYVMNGSRIEKKINKSKHKKNKSVGSSYMMNRNLNNISMTSPNKTEDKLFYDLSNGKKNESSSPFKP